MASWIVRLSLAGILLIITLPGFANTAPVVDTFAVTPSIAAPGQAVTLNISAHDPDCAVAACSSGCGVTVRSDLVAWWDDTGRVPAAFQGSTPAATATVPGQWNHVAVGTYDGSMKSHPVGIALNANGGGYGRAVPLDGNGVVQGLAGADANGTNDLRLAGDFTLQCISCHGVHHADGNTNTVDNP